MMALVNAFWKQIPKEMLNMMKSFGMKESEMIDQMDEALFDCMDENSDVKITFEEWHKALTSGALKTNIKAGI